MKKPSPPRIPCRTPFCFLFFSLGLCVLLFHGVLFGDRQFNYRDEAHFYHPLYRYIQTELSEGRFPLWTPYGNIGQPFFANAAMGVLYPPKLIFFLPADYSLLFNWFLVGHALLACVTLYRLARFWRLSVAASTLGAIAYGFSGGVFSQYNTSIFLIGAAWLPEAILWADRALVRRSARDALVFAAVLAILILAGDPQTALHAGLIATLLALFRWQRERILRRSATLAAAPVAEPAHAPWRRHRIVLLTWIVAATFCLSAVQVIPSSELAKLSSRAGHIGPRSVWEIPAFLLSSEKDGQRSRWQVVVDTFLYRDKGRGKLDSHHSTLYNFSTHPIQFATFLWPSFGGHLFPENTQWLSAFDSILTTPHWVMTFYIGIVPFLLAMASLRFRLRGEANVRAVWLTWVLIIALLGSLGWYGPGWFLYRMFGLTEEQTGFGFPVGGVYWMLQTFVPGYVQFRYPAKLITLAMFPLAMLAAYGWDRLSAGRGVVFVRNMAIIVLVLSLFLLVPSSNVREWILLAPKVVANDYSGPFLPELARSNMICSLLQTSAVLAVFLVFLRLRNKSSLLVWAILGCTAADLYLACEPTLSLTARSEFRTERSLLDNAVLKDAPESAAPHRLFLHAAFGDNVPYPASYRNTSSPDRWTEALRWERNHLLHMFYYDLPRTSDGNLPLNSIFEGVTLLPYDYLDWIHRNLNNEWHLEKNLAFLDTEYVLMSSKKPLDSRWATPVAQAGKPEGWSDELTLWKINEPKGRVRIERENEANAAGIPGEEGRLVHYEPGRVVAEATLSKPGTVVLAEQFWPGWRLDVETLSADGDRVLASAPGTIKPVQNIFRGTDLPEGRYRLTYRYDPDSFRRGAFLSATAWGVLFFLLLARAVGVGTKRQTRPRRWRRDKTTP